MFADNDAGAVATYTQAGAQYGLHLLWILALLLPVTYFVQEMVVRLGIATGKGHALMIFKKFGRWWGSFSLVDLLIVNFLTLITEFALISLVMSRFGISPYWSVPVIGVGLVALVLTTNYTRWERAMITLCLLDTAWIFLFFMHRNCAALSVIPPVKLSSNLIFLVVAIVGTTVAPWQLFFQQSCVADKKLKFCHLKYERLDTFIGAVLTVTMAGCMMFFGRVVGNHYTDPAGMAVYLSHKLGSTVGFILLILLCDAAILGTVAVSLASAWAYGEVKGWPHSLQLKWRDARGFYSTYTLCVLLAAGIVLIPKMPLQLIIVGVQVLAGIMLPSAIIFLQLLLNDRSLMGEYANKPWNNVINWTVIGVLTALSLILAAQVVTGQR
jgi:Mn2+/Fe2+ NRAMP family transporter